MDQVKEPLVATDEEAVIAREAAEKLSSAALAGVDVRLRVAEKADIVVPLPARAVAMIVEVLTAMAQRKPVSVLPHTAELTTNQAADFLNVSRPYLVGLLEKEQIPYRKVGTHRRIRVADLQAFKDSSSKTRREAIASMVAEAQRLKLP
ncbi:MULTISPECIES: helix-turn-helix domain-containing protein [Bradyrhizobium]|uniref:helix-turn-helix domain-containing protein n=1 Tax=Bradyrhizobium japonicum TaxID=375 RepID=UPI0020A17C32|nr:helix-turn-helix domain-containing protein [Bradyrhizobium japonicum]MCP1778801.1 excisionase family DNA binding protein [Bradyrhizobium japonicum]MCP1958201.1 excisionase family DNA binding protein [Bradyrhizobium japonicum]